MKTNSDKPKILSSNAFPVIGIGASAGGLEAFKLLIKKIPENSGMAYVLVQHLHPGHESLLPELLQKVTSIPVLEISDDIEVLPDHIYILPTNKMLVANDGVLQLSPRPVPNKNQLNLPIDLFFTSLAEVHQAHAIGVVLSGTGSDGTIGLKSIKAYGGITFAQDEVSAAFEGMPKSAIGAGVVDFILSPAEIVQKLIEIKGQVNLSDEELLNISQQDEVAYKQILSLLRIRKGTDFAYYKQTTIRRRILRRIALNKYGNLITYLKKLRENISEQDALYQDILIPVTSFFREPEIFDVLCESVFPQIVKNKSFGNPIRIWVAGCSTGEEAYSLAICFKEYLNDNQDKVQIFATDISEPAIAKARTGIYKKNEIEGISPHRLQEYFTKTDDGYQINKDLRQMCVFAIHNFIKDPPFGKIDFLSCRNVLIYMEPYLQKRAFTTFHYALNPKAFLLLGKSESSSSVPDLFSNVDKKNKLYIRKDVPAKFMHVASPRNEQSLHDLNSNIKSENLKTDFQKTADDIVLSHYTPAGVVVNEVMDIVYFRGNTGNYLEQGAGKPSHNLLKMAKDGLAFELRNLLHKAKKENAAVLKENITVVLPDGQHIISIEAVPLPNLTDPHYLILFHDNNYNGNKSLAPGRKKSAPPQSKKNEKDLRILQLEKELEQMHKDMHCITEEQEAANEELQSANEELLSGSEELQSLNEELEASKEELQSTNEELTILNQELNNLNEQVTEAKNYAESIVATIREPLLVLDKNLRVKTANTAFYKTFGIGEKETTGVLIYDVGDKQWNIPELRTLLEEILPQKTNLNDFEIKHHFKNTGNRIMLLNAIEIPSDKIDEKLILLAILDITEQKINQFQLEEKVKLRTIELSNANEMLLQKNNELESFNYISSHDLQEPLRKILTFIDILFENEIAHLSDRGKGYFQRIQFSARRMQLLITDLLTYSQTNLAKRLFENYDLKKIIEEVKNDLLENILEKNAIIDSSHLGQAYINIFQFRQVMHNLISNSLKFSIPGVLPHIIIKSAIDRGSQFQNVKLDPDKNYCHISFADNGIGFDPQYKDKIFEVFQRLHNNQEFEGTGIGLAIIKKIVENHNGTITASGELNKGATFDIYIPA